MKCAFCKGIGKDPFGLLSEIAVCQVCGGSGKVDVAALAIKCAFCRGTGVNPLGARVTCIVCGGKGKVTVSTGGGSASGGKGAIAKCPKCKGTGAARANGLPCVNCRGKGFVKAAEGTHLKYGLSLLSEGNKKLPKGF